MLPRHIKVILLCIWQPNMLLENQVSHCPPRIFCWNLNRWNL